MWINNGIKGCRNSFRKCIFVGINGIYWNNCVSISCWCVSIIGCVVDGFIICILCIGYICFIKFVIVGDDGSEGGICKVGGSIVNFDVVIFVYCLCWYRNSGLWGNFFIKIIIVYVSCCYCNDSVNKGRFNSIIVGCCVVNGGIVSVLLVSNVVWCIIFVSDGCGEFVVYSGCI